MKNIIYFTSGQLPDENEEADIAMLNAFVHPVYNVKVIEKGEPAEYGADRLIPADYVAGDIPDDYQAAADDEENPLQEMDLTDPPVIDALPATMVIVKDTQVITLDNDGTVTLTIEDGVITDAAYTAPG